MVVFLYQSEKLITDSNSQMLNQLNNFTDKYLLERINSLCAEYFSEDSSYPEINSFSKDIQHTSNEEIYSINKTLKTIVSQNDFLHSLILYNGKYDSMISTIDGVVHDAKNPRNQLTIDNTIFSYLSEVSNDFWIPQDDNMAFIDQKNILTFVHYISINDATAFGKKDVTYVLISIDIEDISNFIGNVNGSGVENFLMMDKNNKILTHSENFPDYDKFSEKNPKVFEKIAKSREGQVREKFDNNASLVVWTQSHVNDWKYVYTLSLAPLYRQMLFVIIAIVLITIVILLLGFYFIKRYTKRIYKPFELVIERVKDNIDSDLYSDNEFEMLNSMLSNFNLTKNTISTITEKYNTVIVDKIANDIINGFVSDDNSDLLEQLRLSGATFDKSKFTLLVLELNPLLLTSFPIKQREYVVFNIIDILYNNFNCVPVRTTSSTIEAILNYDDIDIHSVAKTIKDLIPHKSFTNIYCSAFVNSLDKISELHKEAKDVLKYSYVYGFDNIFDVSTLSKMDLDASVVTEKQFTRLENTLTNGDKQEFYHECNKILNAVKTEEHSFNYAQNVIMQIFSVICRVAREQNVPLKDNSAFDKILKNISFDNSAICLFDISD
ncbi:MAG: cache domain-containing protein, partial [Oscillospiraceae bacterium]